MNNKQQLDVFAKAVVNTGRCNSVQAVLDDYDYKTESFHIYQSQYQLFKEVIVELSKTLKGE